MKIIGLCGGSGSGKGAVCDLFLELSIPSIDTDAVYHDMTRFDSPCLRALRKEFGDEIIAEDGSLDRIVLRDIVFCGENSFEKRQKLNTITHAFILDETRRIIEGKRAEGALAVIVDAPLLYESGFDKECDVTVCVIADEDVRISRIVSRDGITKEDAIKRIRGQISNDGLIEKSDFVIENNGDIEYLRSKVFELYKKIII